jgi:hypothetical protein
VPLGYEVRDRRVVTDAREVEAVRDIFRRYLELGCVWLLKEELDRGASPRHTRSLRTSPEKPSNPGLVGGGGWI